MFCFSLRKSRHLNAGVPLDRALNITSELTERVGFRSVVQEILRVVKGGKSLGDSLATKPEYFSDLYINMVRAEAGGSLALSLNVCRTSSVAMTCQATSFLR
ncbi:MAG: type II secretion system F family protein [Bryobacteraceae bacterium]